MQSLSFNRPNDLNVLHDELMAAIPTFHRVSFLEDEGFMGANDDCGSVSGLDDAINIMFADDIDESEVIAVVLAHDATKPRPLNPRELARAAAVQELLNLGITEEALRTLMLQLDRQP